MVLKWSIATTVTAVNRRWRREVADRRDVQMSTSDAELRVIVGFLLRKPAMSIQFHCGIGLGLHLVLF